MPADIDDKLRKVASGTLTALASPGLPGAATTLNADDLSAWPTDTAIDFAIDEVDITGKQVAGSYRGLKGIVSGNTIGSLVWTYGAAREYSAGASTRVYMTIRSTTHNDMVDTLLEEHNQDGTHKSKFVPAGTMLPYAGGSVPAGFLLCSGAEVSRSTYAALFTAIGTAHGVGNGTTTFNLPDGRGRALIGRDNMGGTAANRSQLSTTITTVNGNASATVASAAGLSVGMYVFSANVPAGTTILSISGTTIVMSANASVSASGTAARFSLINDPEQVGGVGGLQTHTLTAAQIAAHTHPVPVRTGSDDLNWSGNGGASSDNNTVGTPFNTQANTGDQPHPNMQPSLVCDWMIAT